MPNHILTTASCDACHGTNAWLPANFSHAGVSGNCGSCHNGVSATGKTPNHILTTESCGVCHNTNAWLPARFDHTGVMGACASGGGDGGGGGSDYPAGYSAPPDSSPLAKLELGDSEHDVRKALGEPDNSNAYMTGKARIPFYFGTDVARTDWMYTGKGRVVFSRNRYTGALKVIRLLYNAQEP